MLAKKVAYNTFIQIFGKVLGFFVSGFLLVLIAERLGTYGMGLYGTIVAFVGFFVTLADLGANLVMVREISQNESHRERITGEFLGFRLTFSLAIMILAPIIAAFIPQYPVIITHGVIIVMVAQFLLLINQMFIGMLQTQLQLDKAVLAEIVNRLINLGIIIWAIQVGYRGDAFFYLVLWATLIGSLINTFITYYFARKLWPVTAHINLKAWQKTLASIAPIGVFTFLGVIHFKADTLLLSFLKSPIDVGIYNYAYKISEIIFTFPVMFVGAVFPKLSQLLTQNKKRFSQLAQVTFDALVIGTVPFLSLIFLLAPFFTVLVARGSYADGLLAGTSLRVLTIALAAWFIGTLFTHILIMANDYKGLIRNLAIAVSLNLVLNLILIPRYSYYGAAAVTGISEIILIVLTWLYMKKSVGFAPRLRYSGPIILSTVFMYLAVSWVLAQNYLPLAVFADASRFVQMVWLLVLGGIGAVVYCACLWLLSGRSLVTDLKGIRDEVSTES